MRARALWMKLAEAREQSHAAPELLAERDALGAQLEHDRTLVADCLTKANLEIDSRHWLTEGRGSYEWNDDRYREEFHAAAVAIKEALAPMSKVAADWTGCPRRAQEIAAARRDLLAENERLKAANAQMLEALDAEYQAWRLVLAAIRAGKGGAL